MSSSSPTEAAYASSSCVASRAARRAQPKPDPRWRGRASAGGDDRHVDPVDVGGQPLAGLLGLAPTALGERAVDVGLVAGPVRLGVPQQDQRVFGHASSVPKPCPGPSLECVGRRPSARGGQVRCFVPGQGRAHIGGEDPTDLVRVDEPGALGSLDVDAVEDVNRFVDQDGRDGAELAAIARLHWRSALERGVGDRVRFRHSPTLPRLPERADPRVGPASFRIRVDARRMYAGSTPARVRLVDVERTRGRAARGDRARGRAAIVPRSTRRLALLESLTIGGDRP